MLLQLTIPSRVHWQLQLQWRPGGGEGGGGGGRGGGGVMPPSKLWEPYWQGRQNGDQSENFYLTAIPANMRVIPK